MFLTTHRLLPLRLLLLLGCLALRSAAANPTENTDTSLNATMFSEVDDEIEWPIKEGEDGWSFEDEDLDGVFEEDELEWPLGNQSHGGLQKRDDLHRNLHENKLVDCYRNTSCHGLEDLSCRAGYTAVGWDRDKCYRVGVFPLPHLHFHLLCHHHLLCIPSPPHCYTFHFTNPLSTISRRESNSRASRGKDIAMRIPGALTDRVTA